MVNLWLMMTIVARNGQSRRAVCWWQFYNGLGGILHTEPYNGHDDGDDNDDDDDDE